MRSWTLHLPPETAASAAAPAAATRGSVPSAGSVVVAPAALPRPAAPPRAAVLVPEGFSLFATLVPALWFLARGLWLLLCLYLALTVLAALLLPAALLPWAVLAAHLLIGLQAQDLRRWSLARRGLPVAAVVLGRNAEAALLRALEARPDLARRIPA